MQGRSGISNADNESLAGWMARLGNGDHQAAAWFWEQYFSRLVGLSDRRLGTALRRMADEEDVAIQVFESFCRGIADGRFRPKRSHQEVWSLLAAMVRNRAVSQIRHQTCLKRGGGSTRGWGQAKNGLEEELDQLSGSRRSPEACMIHEEERQRFLGRLKDDSQRRIVELREDGFSTPEIARHTGIPLRSVVRKLSAIRRIWLQSGFSQRS